MHHRPRQTAQRAQLVVFSPQQLAVCVATARQARSVTLHLPFARHASAAGTVQRLVCQRVRFAGLADMLMLARASVAFAIPVVIRLPRFQAARRVQLAALLPRKQRQCVLHARLASSQLRLAARAVAFVQQAFNRPIQRSVLRATRALFQVRTQCFLVCSVRWADLLLKTA